MESSVDTGSLGNPDPEAPRTKLAALGAQPQPAAPMPPAATPAQTGVNPGGQGYNSGQVNPAALAAPTAPAPTGASAALAAMGVSQTPSATVTKGSNWLPTLTPTPPPTPPVQIASTTPTSLTGHVGTAPVASSVPPIQAFMDGTLPATPATPASAAAPGTTTATPGGTTNGYGVPGVSSLPVVGSLFQTQQADLSGVHAAQNADYGEAQALGQERYDYNPGAAPSQALGTINTTQTTGDRANSLAALGGITAAANGTVPSAAELQLRQQSARNQAANLGAARALGGRSAGGVARAATVANAGTNAQTNLDAAQTRATEQATARQQQIAALSGISSQDANNAVAQANLTQAGSSNNLTAQTTADAQAEAQRQALLQAQLTAMGQGTTAATGGAAASAANAAAQNAAKGGFVKSFTDAVGF